MRCAALIPGLLLDSALPALLFLDSQGNELYRFSGGTIDTASMLIAIEKATVLLRESE
ncbi:MAG: hypothetical protein JKY56_19880 [Kofleriaceae bacterium]|nr:hypothetical protein [Kofleriaceae bacterium]